MREANSTTARVRISMGQFGRYLRTGLWSRHGEDIELKFNPWHDPATGRFTFKGGGGGGASSTWQGGGFTGGGGGSFGGSGASGGWDPSSPKKAGGSTPRKQPGVLPVSPAAQAALSASTRNASGDHVVVHNRYSYTLDSDDRTVLITGTLSLASDPQRSRSAQSSAGGIDRLTTDDGGHYIAARFDGPTDTFNHFAQDANFNRGGYRVLESGWANDIKTGKQVYVAITPTYDGSSKRPSTITVVYSVNGLRETRSFPNGSKGKSHGK